jgi:hypothetical protein
MIAKKLFKANPCARGIMKTTACLFFMFATAFLLFTGCGESKSNAQVKVAPPPDVSKALAYKVFLDDAGPIGVTGYIIAERWVVVGPNADDHQALAQTAIKAALEGLAKFKANSCRVFVLATPADKGTGRHLAQAMYVPSGKGPDGADSKRWQVQAAPKGHGGSLKAYAIN